MQIEKEYVAARRVLLDALEALEGHLDSLVLVGAQAVYLHTGESELNVPLFTADAGIALNTKNLRDEPEIGDLLRSAGFKADLNPGHKKTSGRPHLGWKTVSVRRLGGFLLFWNLIAGKPKHIVLALSEPAEFIFLSDRC